MTISIRLTEDEEERLDNLARRTGRSKSFYVKTALREYLTDLEDAFAADAVACHGDGTTLLPRGWDHLKV